MLPHSLHLLSAIVIVSLPSEVGGNFPPLLGIPFYNPVMICIIFKPSFGSFHYLKQLGITFIALQCSLATSVAHPCLPGATVAIYRHVGTPHLLQQCKPVNNGKEFSYIISGIRERPFVKSFFACGNPHATVFHHSRVAAASSIHSKAVGNYFRERLVINYRAAANASDYTTQDAHLRRIVATESGNSLLAR